MTRTISTVRTALAAAAVLVVAGCGGATQGVATQAPPTAAPTTAEPAREPPEPLPGSEPPAVTVRGAGDAQELDPWTWCWSGLTGGGCADGAPPQDPPDVGAADQVAVSFPVPGWTFAATFRPVGQTCAREQRVDLGPAVDRSSTSGGTVTPAGPAGTYDVDVSGRGSGGSGDVITPFRWTTPVDGPAAVPGAAIAVLDEHDGQIAGYGVSLAVSGLATTPRRASAHVTVTSSEGASLGLDPAVLRGTCSPEGSVWFDGPSGQGDLASLGSAPFTYDVALTLDGVEHRATATWPRDERSGPDESPDTPLPSVAP